jgi:hypothetical protein
VVRGCGFVIEGAGLVAEAGIAEAWVAELVSAEAAEKLTIRIQDMASQPAEKLAIRINPGSLFLR